MTKLIDLGLLTAERALIFGGPYGNLEATQAVLEKAHELDIQPDHIFCTGDTVAYCANPEETAQLLRNSGIHAIQGNCEQSLANDLDDCGCGFEEGTSCDLASRQWFSYCTTHISSQTREWFAELPGCLRFSFAGLWFVLVHGSPRNINEFVFASTADEMFEAFFLEAEADVILAGHCGLPFTKMIKQDKGELCWHNAGVIGMPANDGTQRGWYSVITRHEDHLVFEHRALDYDAVSAQQKMQQAKLPREYANALTTGLWPSLDILPDIEKQQTGHILKANTSTQRLNLC